MGKVSIKGVIKVLFLCLGLLMGWRDVFAQTVTVRLVDPGPYAPGSSIAAAIRIADPDGKIAVTGNLFQLYLSDANGNFTSERKIGEFSGYYTGFVNGLIPSNAVPGTGYKVRIKTTSPATVSAASNAFTISAGTAVIAKVSSNAVNPAYPEVYGTCFATDGFPFLFVNESTAGATVTANFYDDLNQTDEQTIPINGTGTFNAKTNDYTIFVKAVNNGIVGTKGYLLLNNFVRNSFQTQNSSSVCLPDNSKATVSYSVNITGGGGIQNNYPGTLYTIRWGDGLSTNLTYYQIASTGGILTHDYAVSSCGAKNAEGTVTNKFEVSFRVSNVYCPDQSKNLSGDQAVLSPPKTVIGGPSVGCTGKQLTFTNTSYAGQVVSSVSGGTNCENPNATFQWFVNGVAVPPYNTKKNVPLKYTFPAAGTYTVTLRLTSSTPCVAPDAKLDVCIQDPPQPSFTLPQTACIGSGSVSPVNTSVVTNPCNTPITYNWTVTPATGFSYTEGTTKASQTPKILFTTPGTYTVQLGVNNGVCDAVLSEVQTITVGNVPTATLSPSFSLCGRGQTLTFDNTAGSATRTTFTGTPQPQPDTYQWTVTPLNGIAPAVFANGTTANSQYPQITFPDFGTYEVVVKHTNFCGSVTSQVQQITFKEAPTVNAGVDQVICSDAIATLDGSVSGTYNTLQWSTSGTGTFSNKNTEKPVYTPSAADRAAGEVKLTLKITTSLPGDCANISDEVIIKINPSNTVNSANAKTICTGSAVAYSPTSTVAGSVYNWTVTLSSPNAAGFSTSGSGDINDILTNTSATSNATVIYRITPQANGCDGTPFTLTITVAPKPVLTLTGPSGNYVCSGTQSGIQLSSNVSGTQYTWTVVANGGITGATDQTTPIAVTAINQTLVNTSNVAATVTYTITPVNTNSADECQGAAKTITLTVLPQVPAANAGTDIVLCNQTTVQLQGNDAGTFTGVWTLTSGQSGITFANANQYNTTVNGLKAGQTYTFRWTLSGAGQCATQSDDVQVTNNPPISGNTVTLNTPTVCSGQVISVTGSTPQGGNGTYTYLWESSADGINWTVLTSQTDINLLYPVSETTFFRRSVASGACSDDKSNSVKVSVQPPIANNTISATTTTVCANKSAGLLTGSLPTGADGNYNYQWQSSIDGGLNWANINGATDVSYTTPVLVRNIQYRRVVSSLICTGVQSNNSNVISITVNPDAKSEFTWTNDAGCVPFNITAQNVKAIPYPDRNDVYTWYANNVVIGTGITFPGYTINTDGETVDIRLIVTSKFGCESEVFSHTFTTTKNVKASYTQSVTQSCGTVTVTFTNTSSPIGGGTYKWNFGNGQTSTEVQPGPVTFQAAANGTDVVYNVSLVAETGCSTDQMETTITVKPAVPVARIAPQSTTGCAPFALVVDNISPGTNDKYIYHVVDANGNDVITPVVSTNKSQQTLSIPNQGNYSLYMEAQTVCGTGKSASVPIQVTARTVFAGLTTAASSDRFGCAPHTVRFINTSQGGITYKIDWKDGSPVTVTNNTNSLDHTFTKAGEYDVVLYASNDCAQDAPSQPIKIIVTDRPAAAFNIDNPNGCNEVKVNFTNTTQPPANGQLADLTYRWDFGDPYANANNPNVSELRTPPAHTYSYKGSPYTVRLTVTNRTTGCTNDIIQVITVNAPSISEFRARPDSVQVYPNYQFSFEDQSQNAPKSWQWNFGDGSTSTQQNPTHTYADTGLYKVTLTTTNQYCGTTKSHYVRITGTPGQLYMPNAFTPNSTNEELNRFRAKGSGLKDWHLRIFNNYGQLVWETTQLSARGEPVEAWDGTFKGAPLPQGVYIWQAEARFINGSEWKGNSYNNSSPRRTGAIHLIR
ncbi:PKD domain-containing protein [Mucilaginibacter aquatilis]|uniref:PKD domain-containing protein n=1 Tax=Mucilaginibacter aquatilis TaxID=1517760 RepID=A0A6I4IE16_9SPHI|nr:PKD domain-containing protein [Mucilaginibacter aquatilis]MVN91856.1 PKD domain-containing protein [Mucilaginibacter aquatilis]